MGLSDKIKEFGKTVFGYDESQLVVDGDALVASATVGIKKSGLSKEDAKELIMTDRNVTRNGENLVKSQESSITILPSERVDGDEKEKNINKEANIGDDSHIVTKRVPEEREDRIH